MTAEWYYAKNKQKVGPITAAQLKQLVANGEITRTDMVWKDGMAKWTPAGQVTGLFTSAPTGPPPLTFDEPEAAHSGTAVESPWPAHERTGFTITQWIGFGAAGIFGLVGFASIIDALIHDGRGLCCGPMSFGLTALVIWLVVFNTWMMHGRWVPVDGTDGWLELLRGGHFKREDGTIGSFVVSRNKKFIDFFVGNKLVDSWRVLSWGMFAGTLEVQDMAGKGRSFSKGETLKEKKGNPFHRDRIDNLPGSWLPIDGSNKSVQFTDDGAVVFQGGSAGKYTVSGDEPNEVIRIQMADGSTRQFRVMSLSKNQLVVSEGAEATTYARRQAQRSGGGSSGGARHNPEGVRAGDESTTHDLDGESSHSEPAVSSGPANLLSGFWNWLSGKWKCPQCRSRNTVESNRTLVDRQQEVRTDFARAKGDYQPQAVFNIETYESECVCKACGHEWIQVDKTCLRA